HNITPCAIHLHKVLPMGAGLGGGSADAAVALTLLNDIYQLSLPKEELIELSTELGSDCAFFIYNTPCLVSSKGEVLAPINLSLKGYSILLVHPGIHVSTQQAYAGVKPRPLSIDLAQVLTTDPSRWRDQLINQFEEHLFLQFPEIAAIKQKLYDMGAIYASMSGSGSAVYGLFKDQESLNRSKWPEHYMTKVIHCP
ncbi:MAG TPA: hypothetical protein VK750_02790, partial [Cytophagaceae bacterium]|nr:hypothetical protein [Cytophagaceae bacterium]